ncbi:MAG: response regulator transcription factor [Deltaproteobacteria bacterium]|nr:response regulator transcription factor [Deltaproteobacteria bacterium]
MDTASRKKILIIEDDPALAGGLCDALEFEGFIALHSKTGRDGLARARTDQPDCIILDLMLPDINGYQVCEELRRVVNLAPIIMLTARSQESDKIRGLDAGADDYVTKPFSLGELLARIRAIFRRDARVSAALPDPKFTIGDVLINTATHSLIRDNKTLPLSFYEVELLKLLRSRLGQPVSRDDILDKVWGISANPTNRTVDNFVVKLRKKIEPDRDKPRYILTVYGFGYKLVE